jgi:hypothetical protein
MFDLLEGVLEIFGEFVLELLRRGVIELVSQMRDIFR